MSLDFASNTLTLTATEDARRQIEICNACRYCEGFCVVFPAMTRDKVFSDGDITHLANICHNCRGCYYACQYIPPHEFAINIPQVLNDVRAESWERLARPQALSRVFQERGVAIAGLLVAALAVFFWLINTFRPVGGEGFYAYLAHNAMVAIFAPAFIVPLVLIGLSLRDYWREVGGGRMTWGDLARGVDMAARMKNLDGGHGDGCNFEDGDRFTQRRRVFHQLVLYGFLLCFAATSSGTIMHYVFDWPAPYGFWTPPKLFGVPGGIMLLVGTIGMAWLKTQADPDLGTRRVWGGEMAFIVLLGLTALSGLVLYAATGTAAVGPLLAIHLASVMALFLLMPFSKMVHGFFRFTALVAEAGKMRRAAA